MKTGVVVLTFLVLLILAGVLNRDTVEAQTGTPSIQTTYYISDSDQRVYVNDTFTVRFSMRRTSGGAGNGGISVSFPGLDQADTDSRASAYDSPKASVVTDSYTNGVNKVSYFASGYSPIHRADGTQRTAEYLLVETDDTSWPLNTYRTLELEVTPKTTGLLVINYRYWLCGDGYQNCAYSPTSGSVDDQQGWHVDSFRVLVRNRAPTATRVSPSSRDVELEPGSSQTFTARGRDRDGNLAQVDWYLDDDEWSGGLSLVPTGSYTHSNTFSFPDVGTYRVQAEFTDTIGESDSTYWDVEVGIRVTVASSPSGRTVRVNGTNRTAPYATAWDPGSSLTLDVPSPQNVSRVNDRYVFSHWSHGGSQRQTVRPTTSTTYTANFTLQHFLSTRTEPRGVGVPGGGQWYDHGSTARVGPAPILTGLQFSHWEKGDGQRIGSDPAGVRVTVDTAFLVQAVYTPASAQSPRIDSLGCVPTTVQVGETVSCLPELSGGTPTEYDWDAIGGSPPSGTARSFSTRWNTSSAKRVDLEACNASGCDSRSQTIVVDSGGGACFTNWGVLLTGNISVSGSWDGSCASTHRSGRYGRFYAFTLTQRTRVQIDLTSSVDTYLYLLSGADSRGMKLYEDDDGGTGNNGSHLDVTLESGIYTVEATTYDPGVTGAFNLDIHVEGEEPPQALRPTSLVAELITAEQSHDGMAHVLLTWDPPGTSAGTATWRTEADVGDDNLSKSMVYVIQRLDVNNPGDGWTTLERAWPHQYLPNVSATEAIDNVRTQEYRDEPDTGSYRYRVASEWDNRSQSVWVVTGIVRTVAEDVSLGPPTNVQAMVSNGDVTITWTNGANANRHIAILFDTNWQFAPAHLGTAQTDGMVTFRNVPAGAYFAVVISIMDNDMGNAEDINFGIASVTVN